MKKRFTLLTSLLPRPYAQIVFRWWWLVFLCAFLAAGAALVVSINMTPVYQTSSQLLINQGRSPTGDNYSDLLLSERLASTYANLMTRDTTLNQALAQLGLDPEMKEELITDVRVVPVRDTQLIELTVEGSNPEIVAAVANVLPTIFEEELRAVQSQRYTASKESLSEQLDALSRQVQETQLAIAALGETRTAQEELEYARLTNLLAQYQSSYSDVLQNYESVRLAEAQSVDSIVTMQSAEVPEFPIRPRTKVNVLLAAVVGAMLAIGTVLLVEFLDDRIRNPDDLARITDLPVVGAVARTDIKSGEDYAPDALISVLQPRHPTVEAYRRMRTNLQFYNVDDRIRSLAITSAGAGEGKSLTAANFAVVLAQSGLRVVMVDSDLRRPRQHQLFGLNKSPGLGEAVLSDEITPFLRKPSVEVGNLQILTAGESVPFPAEVLGSQRVKDIIDELYDVADIVVFDTPPVLAVTDAQIVGRLVNGTVLVIDTQQTTGAAVRQALESLLQVNVPMVGAVLNRLSGRVGSYYYMYAYYHYGDESSEMSGKRKRRRTSAPAGQVETAAPEQSV